MNEFIGYNYSNANLNCSHSYILPTFFNVLSSIAFKMIERRVFEIDCGNWSVANQLKMRGFETKEIGSSQEGISKANRNSPDLKLMNEEGFKDIKYKRVGRIAPLTKSMIAVARKP